MSLLRDIDSLLSWITTLVSWQDCQDLHQKICTRPNRRSNLLRSTFISEKSRFRRILQIVPSNKYEREIMFSNLGIQRSSRHLRHLVSLKFCRNCVPAIARLNKGLLMTNPGHVDPGYSGRLHLTVINMSRSDMVLRCKDAILTVIFYKLGGECKAGYDERREKELKISLTQQSRRQHFLRV